MPGHTFLYSPPVNKVRELIHSGELGDVYFITSSRMNLGLYQADGVISDLAPHDLSILLYWLDSPVTHIAVPARASSRTACRRPRFSRITFAGGATANVQISWLAPRKMRQMVVVGSKRMVQYEDTSSDESVRIYDRGLDVSTTQAPASFGEYRSPIAAATSWCRGSRRPSRWAWSSPTCQLDQDRRGAPLQQSPGPSDRHGRSRRRTSPWIAAASP